MNYKDLLTSTMAKRIDAENHAVVAERLNLLSEAQKAKESAWWLRLKENELKEIILMEARERG